MKTFAILVLCFSSALGQTRRDALDSLGLVALGVTQASIKGLQIGFTTGPYDGVGIVLPDNNGYYYNALVASIPACGGGETASCRYDRSNRNTHCDHMEQSATNPAGKFTFPGGECEAWGVDLPSAVTVGAQEDSTVLFFRMTGANDGHTYLYVKFELHGTNTVADKLKHLGTWITTRRSETNGCLSSRKEKIHGAYDITEDPVITLSPGQDSVDITNYANQQRVGCEVFFGREKTTYFFTPLAGYGAMLRGNNR